MMRNMEITQILITKFILRMDYIYGPTSKWRGLYIISAKIGTNTWLYLKTENGIKIHCLDANFDYTIGFVARNHAKMTVKTSNFVNAHPRTNSAQIKIWANIATSHPSSVGNKGYY
jgi:hypothetical protein